MRTINIDKVLNLKEIDTNKKPLHLYNNAIKHQSFDLELYKAITNNSGSMQKTIEEGNNKLKTFSNLSEDLFLNLYKYNPEKREKEEMTTSRKFNYDLISQLSGTEEFQKLRDICKLNVLNSTLGTEILHEKALEKINAIIEKHQQNQNGEDGAQNNSGNEQQGQNPIDFINQLVEQENALNSQIDDLKNGEGGQLGDIRLDKDNAQKLLEKYEQEKKQLNKIKNSLSKGLKKATEGAIDDVREMDNFVNAWGLDGDTSSSRISFEESREALERIRNSDKLKQLTDIIGKFKNIARNSLKNKTKGEGVSIKDITIGNDIAKILPSEKILLSNESTKKLFYKKFNEKQLLQYEVESNNRKGLGPMIVCLDVSGSMNDGERDVWGRALSLALLEIAQKQKRNYALIMFNNDIAREWLIPKGELKPNDILDIAESRYYGGTNFKVPVFRSMDIINEEKHFKKADIVFITDGDCALGDSDTRRLCEMKKKKNVLIQTIIINMGGHCSKGGVEKWSDNVKEISSILDLSEESAEDIFNFSIQGDN